MAKDAENSVEAAAPSPPAKAPEPAAGPAVEELPKAIVRRVVKEKLSQLSNSSSRQKDSKAAESAAAEGEDVSVQRDALAAFAESTRIFIHYLSAAANDICKESKRQTINADDVLKAIEEIDFPEFIEPLRVSLEEFRRKNMEKKSGAKLKAKETEKKRKLGEGEPTQDEDDGKNGAEGEDKEEENDDPDETEKKRKLGEEEPTQDEDDGENGAEGEHKEEENDDRDDNE